MRMLQDVARTMQGALANSLLHTDSVPELSDHEGIDTVDTLIWPPTQADAKVVTKTTCAKVSYETMSRF